MKKLEGTLGEALRSSIVTGKPLGTKKLLGTEKPLGIEDCINFNIDLLDVFAVEGKYCKNGTLSVAAIVFGNKVAHQTVDLNAGEYCNTLSCGIEEIQYCFYMKASCLYTKGHIDGWFHKKQHWDEKIVCI